jgi:murein tripeptide amidase MpaA
VPDDLTFDRYHDYAALTAHLKALAEAHPDLMRLTSIGTSHEGRDVRLATVTNFATGPDSEKPAFWCDGNIHATEVSAASACLYLLRLLLTEHGKRADVTRALDTLAFYIVPRVNPDGAELYFAEKPRYIRSSTRPYPYDEEPLEGLRHEDIDGDGRLLQMRVEDPNGPWKAHPDEPRLLVRREPLEEGGTYYRVFPEGAIDNWDGVLITMQPNREGLDLNRNFPAHWRQEVEQSGAGPFPTSEPEVANLVRFISEHPNITGGLTFHTYSGVLLRPYGTQSDENLPAEDLWTYQKIGEKGTEITGYPNISVFHDFKYHPKEVITGVFDDWMYDHRGVFAWTVEIWSPQRQAGLTEGFAPGGAQGSYKFIDWYREHAPEDDLAMLRWSDEKLGGRGYVDWYEFEHPQLGRVELGGWDSLYALRNPPPDALDAEIAPLAEWALWHALLSPRLELHSFEAKRLGQGAWRVRLVVQNTGWLPSYVTKKALERKVARGLVAEIELPEGATLETGLARMELGQLEGRAYKPAAAVGWTADPTSDRLKVEWVVRGGVGDTVKLTARHERAGTVRAELTLE